MDSNELRNTTQLQVYALDRRKKMIYKSANLSTASSLFYHGQRLYQGHLFHSQTIAACRTWRRGLLKTCVAENFQKHLKNAKQNIFLTIYRSNYIESHKILNIVNEIAQEVQDLDVELVKINAKYNSISAEYSYDTYPVHFFIPKGSRDEDTVRYINQNSSKEEILEFIKTNILKYVALK